MSSSPRLSVLLPVYNCETYLAEAIDSILRQGFTDYEFIIIDDGSSDRSAEIIRGYGDPRIRFYQQANMGLAATLNRGISLARGEYIARQDQDDISLPQRLERQVAYMDSHPTCGLLGTWARILEVDHPSDRYHRHPSSSHELQYQLLFNNPFVHSSVMLRKSHLEAVGGYSTDPERQPPEDYELWSRLARHGDVANLEEVLLLYREIPSSMSRQGISPFQARLVRICSENIALAAAVPVDDPDALAIAALTHGNPSCIQAEPNFDRMQSILEAAIGSFGQSEATASLRKDAADRIHLLRTAWRMRTSPLYGALQRPGPLRRAASRLWSIRTRLRPWA